METTPTRKSLMELSTAVAPWTHIRQIRLEKSRIESQYRENAAQLEVRHSFDADTQLDRGSKTLTVRARLFVSAAEALRIDAQFVLEYDVDESLSGVPKEASNAFGRMNGIHNVWPYWREYVQSVTTRLGFPPLTLPLVTGASLQSYYDQVDRQREVGQESSAADDKSSAAH